MVSRVVLFGLEGVVLGVGDRFEPDVLGLFAGDLKREVSKPRVSGGAVPVLDVGGDVDEGMLAVAVGTATVIGEEARDKRICQIKNVQFFHISLLFNAKVAEKSLIRFAVRLKFLWWRRSIISLNNRPLSQIYSLLYTEGTDTTNRWSVCTCAFGVSYSESVIRRWL